MCAISKRATFASAHCSLLSLALRAHYMPCEALTDRWGGLRNREEMHSSLTNILKQRVFDALHSERVCVCSTSKRAGVANVIFPPPCANSVTARLYRAFVFKSHVLLCGKTLLSCQIEKCFEHNQKYWNQNKLLKCECFSLLCSGVPLQTN